MPSSPIQPAMNLSSHPRPFTTSPSSTLPITPEAAEVQNPPPSLPLRRTKRKDYLARRICLYLTDEVLPRPRYQFKRIKKSKKEYTTRMRLYLDNFDAIMEQFDE